MCLILWAEAHVDSLNGFRVEEAIGITNFKWANYNWHPQGEQLSWLMFGWQKGKDEQGEERHGKWTKGIIFLSLVCTSNYGGRGINYNFIGKNTLY